MNYCDFLETKSTSKLTKEALIFYVLTNSQKKDDISEVLLTLTNSCNGNCLFCCADSNKYSLYAKICKILGNNECFHENLIKKYKCNEVLIDYKGDMFLLPISKHCGSYEEYSSIDEIIPQEIVRNLENTCRKNCPSYQFCSGNAYLEDIYRLKNNINYCFCDNEIYKALFNS